MELTRGEPISDAWATLALHIFGCDWFAQETGRERLSRQTKPTRVTVPQIRERKSKEKIVGLTAYSAPMAANLDPWVDLLLVGDSLGMGVHGPPTTVGVTLDMMILHGRAVVRGS